MPKKRPVKRAKKSVKGRRQRSIFAYPAVIFVLLCIGVFLVGWTLKSGAADVIVNAKVSAPFVTGAATITSPADGTHVSAVPITVSGSCPDKAAYVEIFDGNQMAGAA